MKAVPAELSETVRELQSLKSLNKFSLGGGTNLALRYNHRISDDIDLFCPHIIGRTGFEEIVNEVNAFYKGNIYSCDFPCDIDDQYIFLRFFVRKNEVTIKVEVLQNFKTINKPEIGDDIRLLTEKDIGLLKLMSVAGRASNKDVYDLEYITEHIPLIDLYELLKYKQKIYNKQSDQTIFDLDNEGNPVNNPELLLKFDVPPTLGNRSRPIHSHDRIMIVDGEKTWMQARSGWRRKVRHLFNYLGEKFPDITGIDF